jgi:hypothetical protein
LLHLQIKLWSAKRTDNDANTLITNTYAVENSKRVEAKKHLINPDAFSEVRNVAQRARVWHYEHSVAWTDNGLRMVGAVTLDEHTKKLREFRSDFDRAVAAFRLALPDALKEGKKALGGLAKDEDYPSEEEIMGKFQFAFDVLPVPDAKDIRVELSAEGLKEVEESITRTVAEASNNITQETTSRVAKTLQKLVEKLAAKKKGDSKEFAIFRDSLLGNVKDLIPVIKELNILGDPLIEKLADDLQTSLTNVDPSAVREDETVRNSVLEKANDILAKVTKGGYGKAAA